MTDPSRPPQPAAGLPPDYPYGGPAGDPSLLGEPGSGRTDGVRAPAPGVPPGPGAAPGGPGGPGYAPPGYAPPGYAPPGYAPPGFVPLPPENAAVRAQATAALVVSILLVVPCFDLPAVPAIVIAAIALNRARTDVPVARTLTRVAWVWIAASVALAVGFLAWTIATGPAPSTRTPATTATTGSPAA